ncbi:hypothetical protein TYRP_005296 [Tyrophagus putrescentiae]|nr:hypothetical protein TYRP_005296 [Tyrophagus putrescentiae]
MCGLMMMASVSCSVSAGSPSPVPDDGALKERAIPRPGGSVGALKRQPAASYDCLLETARMISALDVGKDLATVVKMGASAES